MAVTGPVRDFGSQMPHGFRPVGKVFEIDAENAVDDKIRSNGNVRAFMRHVSFLMSGGKSPFADCG